MVTTFTYKPSLVRIDARNFEIVVTDPHRPPARQSATDDVYCVLRLQYTAPQFSAQCN